MAGAGVNFANLDTESKLVENNKLLNQLLKRTEGLETLKTDLDDVKNRLSTAEVSVTEIEALKTSVEFMSKNYDQIQEKFKKIPIS